MTEIGGRPLGQYHITLNASLTARSFMMIVTAKFWIILHKRCLQTYHRLLSAGVCRHTVSPLSADRFPDTRFRQADREAGCEFDVERSTTSVPRSTSESSSLSSMRGGIGIAALGESLTVSAARA